MAESANPQAPVPLRTWIRCLLSLLLMFAIATWMRSMAAPALDAHERSDFRAFEQSSHFFFRLVSLVWIPLALAAAWGLRLLLRGRRTAGLSWFLWMTIAFTVIQAALFCRLFYRIF